MFSLNKFVVLAGVATSVLLSACGGSSYSSGSNAPASNAPASSTSAGTLVKTGSVSSAGGTVLVNAQGLTLYRLSGEHAGKFICASSCLKAWHPLTVKAGSKPSGSVGSLAVVNRPDGKTQVTYKGMPLYTFAQDSAPGQANGQGVKDVGTWMAVTTSAAKSTGQSQSSPPASSGGGYG